MAQLPLSEDFRSIVLNETPLIDVRAPVEFAKGSFPHAVNLPLMDDEERRVVGIRYKEEGNEAAVKLGHSLVNGEVKETRIKAWRDFIEAHPDAKLFCFRGGQRSQIAQQWLHESGTDIVRLKGGYKAFRNYLMHQTDQSVEAFKPIILGGRTGSGKTILLQEIANAIDLEGLANHRGSSFGREITPQPSQINFENALAYKLIQQLEKGYEHLVFEDEGRGVGRVYLPQSLIDHLSHAPLVILETPEAERVAITFDEYVAQAQQQYAEAFADQGFEMWAEDICSAMERIKKRLGGLRYREVTTMFEEAYETQKRTGEIGDHEGWVTYLLKEYYDPMYDYQIDKNAARVVFRGSAEEVKGYLSSYR